MTDEIENAPSVKIDHVQLNAEFPRVLLNPPPPPFSPGRIAPMCDPYLTLGHLKQFLALTRSISVIYIWLGKFEK